MRRILAILLLAAFGLPVAASALALAQDSGTAHLPACCRRNGVHHCTGQMAASTNAPTVSATCPRFPQPSTTAPANSFAALAPASPLSISQRTTLTLPQQAETQHRLSRERSRHKRGPPTFSL